MKFKRNYNDRKDNDRNDSDSPSSKVDSIFVSVIITLVDFRNFLIAIFVLQKGLKARHLVFNYNIHILSLGTFPNKIFKIKSALNAF